MNETIESDLGQGFTHRPACDNCKARKTKCDRNSPCSGCVALRTSCRVSHRPQEKKQRILLSTRYEEAVEDINHQLQDIAAELHSLRDEVRSGRSKGENLHANVGHSTEINHNPVGQVEAALSHTYNGESSFNAHAQVVTSTLASLDPLGRTSNSSIALPAVQELLRGIDTPSSAATESEKRISQEQRVPKWQDMTLPPLSITSKLLRLAKTYKQNFFAFIPLFDEEDFVDLCRKVYVPIDPPSLPDWIVVNTGVATLLEGLESRHFAALETTVDIVWEYVNLSTVNATVGWESIGLSAEPDIETCRALALFGTSCIRSGRSGEAWRSLTAASRMCLDLGLHRIPNSRKNRESTRERLLFWHVYAMETGLAFTCGRTSTFRTFDISSARPSFPDDLPEIPAIVSSGFLDFAIVETEIYTQLFSAAGLQDPPTVRVAHAKSLAAKLHQIQASLKSSRNDCENNSKAQIAIMSLDVVMFCLLTVVYRMLPPEDTNPHPLQCCDECIDAARNALSTLVEVGERRRVRDAPGWHNFLNIADLSLLSATATALEAAAGKSQTMHRLHDVCSKFYQIAVIFHYQQKQSGTTLNWKHNRTRELSAEDAAFPMQVDPAPIYGNNYPMLQQHWDDIMENSLLEFGNINTGEMVTFVEPYLTSQHLGPFN